MKRYPAIALIEFSDVAGGILAGDAMVKRAPIAMLKTGTVSRGKYLVLIGGSVASVEEAYAEGVAVGGESVLDCVLLPHVHDQVHDAVLGQRRPCAHDALGVVDAGHIPAILRCSDAAVKGAAIDLVELRLGNGLGGKAIALYNGLLEDVEAALAIARASEDGKPGPFTTSIIPRLDPEMAKQLDSGTRFDATGIQTLDGEDD